MLHQGRGHCHFPAAVSAGEASLLDAAAWPSSLLAPVAVSDPSSWLRSDLMAARLPLSCKVCRPEADAFSLRKQAPQALSCWSGVQVSKDVGSGVTHYVCVHIASETTTKEMRTKDPSSPVALPKLPDGMAEVATARWAGSPVTGLWSPACYSCPLPNVRENLLCGHWEWTSAGLCVCVVPTPPDGMAGLPQGG